MNSMPPHAPPRKPLLIYDGDCAFCRRAVAWSRRITGEAVDYRPYQEVAEQFPHISLEQFRAAAQLVDCDGAVRSGAEAVYGALARARRWRWLLWLHRRSSLFRSLSERAYRWVARHRDGLGRLLGGR